LHADINETKQKATGMALQERDDTVRDKDTLFYGYFTQKQRDYIKLILNDQIIEEHRLNPIGQHSEPLERILAYCRRLPMNEQLAIKKDSEAGNFMIIRMSGKRGVPPTVVDTQAYKTLNEAYHGVFLKYINVILES
jgi:branched-chain amino acid transport system permease protein